MDYRGWGLSSGKPDENGVIMDGMTVLEWVLKTANVDPSRVLLVAQSLGTGISMGVAAQYVELHPSQPLAGIVTIAAFTSLRGLVGGYRMGGVLPLLGPLAIVPKLRDYFIHRFLRAEFDSTRRMQQLATTTKGTDFSITFVHAKNDWEISYQHSRQLFHIACAGNEDISETQNTDRITRWIENGRIKHIETTWGGHNDIQKGDAVLKAVLSAWR
jgi:abhydrolase domain-containing protein 12